MRTFLFFSGTSVEGNLERSKIPLEPAAITATRLAELGPDVCDELSSEIGTLAASRPDASDAVHLLTSDTDKGFFSATLVKRIAELRFGVQVSIQRIVGLGFEDAAQFRTVGLPGLVSALDSAISAARAQGSTPIVSIAAGINPVLPYIAFFSMLRRIPLTYRFQRTRALVTLPPLPIAFDYDALRTAGRTLADLQRETTLRRHELVNRLGDELIGLEGLFEQVDRDEYTLSAFGLMLLEDLNVAAQTQVLLSPAAARTLREAGPRERKPFETMLSMVRNPLWRAAKRHAFASSDLEVYKTGRTACRLAGWSDPVGCRFFAAELLLHDAYDRRLGERRIADYPPETFERWQPPEDEPPLDVNEADAAMMAQVQGTVRTAEARADEWTRRAKALESEVEEFARLAESAEAEAKLARVAADAAEARANEERTAWRAREMQLAEELRTAQDDARARDAAPVSLAPPPIARHPLDSESFLTRLRWALFRR